jgi:galactitol-specific phosphotransferase system IIC component
MDLTPSQVKAILLGGLLTIGFGMYGVFRDWQFSHEAVLRTTGVVSYVGKSYLSFHRGWTADYSYQAENQMWHANGVSITSSIVGQLRVMHAAPIKYLAGSPGVSRIDFSSEDKQTKLGHWLKIVFGGFMLLFLSLQLPWAQWWGPEPSSREW